MIDMKPTIQAKSDQLNADDLIAGPMTIRITQVNLGSAPDQPISIRFEGDNGKPWKPCLTMRRLLVSVWGADGHAYVGQSVTLYRDPNVKWGGAEVGGIRVSHMSGIKEKRVVALTATRGKKAPVSVVPMVDDGGFAISEQDFQNWASRMDGCDTVEEIQAIGGEIAHVADRYDAASVSRLKSYYKNKLSKIKEMT